jgi:hypothetical protein
MFYFSLDLSESREIFLCLHLLISPITMVIGHKIEVGIWNHEVEPRLSNLDEGCQMLCQHAKYSNDMLGRGLEVLSQHDMS